MTHVWVRPHAVEGGIVRVGCQGGAGVGGLGLNEGLVVGEGADEPDMPGVGELVGRTTAEPLDAGVVAGAGVCSDGAHAASSITTRIAAAINMSRGLRTEGS